MVLQPHYQHQHNKRVSESFSISLLYHDIFKYPLKERELAKWQAGDTLRLLGARPRVETRDGYYFLKGRDFVGLRLENEAESRKKLIALAPVKSLLEKDNNILMVGITGSLAMSAASAQSDIDLMVIVRRGRLWQTRLKTLFRLMRFPVATRRAGDSEQADKLCLNIWMDERDLCIHETFQNIYTAHEISQIIPLINREGTYEKLLSKNRWVLNYWPNALEVGEYYDKNSSLKEGILIKAAERMCYLAQRLYMRGRITREIITSTRAFFHPIDWSHRIRQEFERRGVGFK